MLPERITSGNVLVNNAFNVSGFLALCPSVIIRLFFLGSLPSAWFPSVFGRRPLTQIKLFYLAELCYLWFVQIIFKHESASHF